MFPSGVQMPRSYLSKGMFKQFEFVCTYENIRMCNSNSCKKFSSTVSCYLSLFWQQLKQAFHHRHNGNRRIEYFVHESVPGSTWNKLVYSDYVHYHYMCPLRPLTFKIRWSEPWYVREQFAQSLLSLCLCTDSLIVFLRFFSATLI